MGRWLAEQGYADVFLDIDPASGLLPGDRWMEALKSAADRCEAVLCLVSHAWLGSKWCLAEFLLAKSLHKRIFGLIIEPVPFDRLPPEMTAEWQLCELVGPDRFREFRVEDRTVAFREAGLDRLRRGLERAGLDARGFPWPPPNEQDRAPYRGLRALEPQDAAIFFGRDAAIIRGIDQLRGMAELGVEKLLVVLGASGAGKSSFLRAGLWPRLARDDAHFLPLPVIRPQDAVISGSTGLAVALSAAFARLGVRRALGPVKAALGGWGSGTGAASGGSEALAEMLDELAALARARLVQADPDAPQPTVILTLDQAEELFNADGAAEGDAFLAMLAALLVPGRRVLAIATIRTDRYPRLQDEALLPGVKRALFDLSPMPAAEFKSVIEGPAQRATESGHRLGIDPALTEALIAGATGGDALPLLGFTLERLWLDYGANGRLTWDDYSAMGGVQGSIEAAIAAALAEPAQPPAIPADKAAQHALLRAAFIPWLARVDPATGERMRRSARAEDIPAASRPIVERFIAARLLLADRRDGADAVEVAHESLLRQWPTLLTWLDADTADLKLAEEIEHAAAEWARNGNHDDWLDHRAARLAEAERLLRRDDFRQRLGPAGEAYLAACRSREAAESVAKEAALAQEAERLREIAAEQSRRGVLQSRMKRFIGMAAVVAVLFLALGLWQQGRLADRQAALDDQRKSNLTLQQNIAQQQMTLQQQQSANFALQAEIKTQQAAVENEQRDNLGLKSELDARQAKLDRAQVNLLTELAASETEHGNLDGALRIGVHATQRALALGPNAISPPLAPAQLAATLWQAAWDPVLSAYRDPVMSVSATPAGVRIVTAADDNTAAVWDAAQQHRIAVLSGHVGKVASALFNPDGSRVVTTSADGTIRVWDAESGRPFAVIRPSDPDEYPLKFSPDGASIVTTADHANRKRAIFTIWDSTSGRQKITVTPAAQSTRTFNYSPDGMSIVTVSNLTNYAALWDAHNGRQVAELEDDGRWVQTIGIVFLVGDATYSPDGKRIAFSARSDFVQILDVASRRPVGEVLRHSNRVTSIRYSPDGSHIVTTSLGSRPQLWEAGSSRKIAELGGTAPGGDQSPVEFLAFSQDGTRIATASDSTVQIWDAADGKPVTELRGHEASVQSAAFSPDGRRIFTKSDDGTLRSWNAEGPQPVARITSGGGLRRSAYGPDGTHIVGLNSEGRLLIWNPEADRITGAWGNPELKAIAFAFSASGNRLVIAYDGKPAEVWDTMSARMVATLGAAGHEAVDVAISADGTRVAARSSDAIARVWDTVSGQQIASLMHQGKLTSVDMCQDGNHVVTVAATGDALTDGQVISQWDAVSGRPIAVLPDQNNTVFSAVYSPDCAHLAVASNDGTGSVWDAVSLRPITVLRGHRRSVTSIAYTRNGKQILTSSWDGTARIWDAAGGRPIAVLPSGQWSIDAAAFSPDGTRVVESADTLTLVWDTHILAMPASQLVVEACTRKLSAFSTLSRAEMQLVGYLPDEPRIDVCKGVHAD